MQQWIIEHRISDQYYYSVYNSRGQLALWTTSRYLAEYYADQFQQNTSTTEIRVSDPHSQSPKRS